MKINSLFLVLILFISNTLIGQTLNEYKYVIIPSKYDFQKSEDQYQLNSLTKFLFEKEGFIALYDNLEKPADVVNNPCAVLTAHINNESNMFTTKMVIELVNCKNQKVLTSQEGRSKAKDYKKGYQEALREAFESVTAQNYNYVGIGNSTMVNTAVDDVKKAVNEAVESVVEEVEEMEEVENTETSEEEILNETPIVQMEEVIEVQEAKVLEKVEETKQQTTPSLNTLYAQANILGYQLVDSSPKVVYVLLNTSKKDVFLLKGQSGMIYKENGSWFVEYYNQNELVKKPLDIKF